MEKSLKTVDLNVLNLASFSQGKTVSDAFTTMVELAQHAEKLGYKRYWLAEHHNLDGIASAATSVLIGHVAGHTKTIRVGSGGIMLPNHSPYIIAEQFGTLATLYPDRIDLGLGRAPGSDQQTMRAVRGSNGSRGDDFPEQIDELLYYFSKAEEGQRIRAIPGNGIEVPIWILGSSLFSARLAARLGRPYAFAGHFAPAQMADAFTLYRQEFVPSKVLDRPHIMVGVQIVAAETDAKAEYLATSVHQRFLSLIRGKLQPTPPPVVDMSELWYPEEERAVKSMMSTMIIGGPQKVKNDLNKMIQFLGADEVIVTSDLFDFEERKRSFEIIAGAKFN